MHLIAADLHALYQVLDFAIYAHLHVALLADLVEELAVVPLAAAHQGAEYDDLPAVVVRCDLLQHLVLGVPQHGFAADVAVGRTGPGVEEP